MDPVWLAIERELQRRGKDPQAWVAGKLGISIQAVNNWLQRGKVPKGRYDEIAEALGWTVERLKSDKVPLKSGTDVPPLPFPKADAPTLAYAGASRNQTKVPVVGTAQLGEDGYYEELEHPTGHGDGYVEHYSADANAYALRVKGDSMHPTIRHGQFVLIEPHGQCVPGENVLLSLVDGRKMVKELVTERADSITVMSVNGGHRMTFERAQVMAMHPVAAIISASKWRPD